MKPTILACDDEVFILRAVQMKLDRSGFDVITASNGAEALETLERTPVNLLITDLQMPRVDGLQLISQVRARRETAELPVILLTAKGFEYDEQQLAQKFPGLVLLAKPFSPRELLLRVNGLLDQQPSQPASRPARPPVSTAG